MTKRVKDAWRQHKVVSLLFLDIEAAFPSATPEVLFHNMRKQGVPRVIVDWLRRKLDGRRTRLKFDDFVSPLFDIISGIDQGCPLSVILFQFYNSDLPDLAREHGQVEVYLNIDDAVAIKIANTREDALKGLADFMTQDGAAQDWSQEHNSQFELSKFHLLNMSSTSKDLGPPLEFTDKRSGTTVTIKPSNSETFLGLRVDRQLRFREHVKLALEKGTTWVKQFRRLAKMNTGVPLHQMRQLYTSIALPSMLYAADIFLEPILVNQDGKRKGSIGHIKKLASVHRQALSLITGALRTTATDSMETLADLPPFDTIVDRACHRAAVRLCTLPENHPLHPHVQNAARYRQNKRHRSPLHNLMRAYSLVPKLVEKIPSYRLPPEWTPDFRVEIAENKEKAIESEHQWRARDGVRAYSDGSDYKGGVGAAAALFTSDLRANTHPASLLGPLCSEHSARSQTGRPLSCAGAHPQAEPGHQLLHRARQRRSHLSSKRTKRSGG